MRQLTSTQKKELNKTGATSINQLTDDALNDIKALNDFETFYVEVDKYLSDMLFFKICK